MPYILVDTCVFVRLNGDYKRTLKCILTVPDIIAITKEILNEYGSRAYAGRLILQAFLEELESKGAIKHFKKSFVDSGLKRYENIRTPNYPSHSPDKKWIRTAIAIDAKYIVSTNKDLLETSPNRRDGDMIEIIEPSQYTQIRCPNGNQTC